MALPDLGGDSNKTNGASTSCNLGKFMAPEPPTISIAEYLDRLTKYAPINDELLVVSLIYLDRLNVQVNAHNIHRLLLTSILVAVKFYSDIFYSNSYFARVGGVPAPEINELERLFLCELNFSLLVKQDEYQLYQNEILRHSAHISGVDDNYPPQVPVFMASSVGDSPIVYRSANFEHRSMHYDTTTPISSVDGFVFEPPSYSMYPYTMEQAGVNNYMVTTTNYYEESVSAPWSTPHSNPSTPGSLTDYTSCKSASTEDLRLFDSAFMLTPTH